MLLVSYAMIITRCKINTIIYGLKKQKPFIFITRSGVLLVRSNVNILNQRMHNIYYSYIINTYNYNNNTG